MQSLKNLTVQNHLLNFNLHHTNQLEVFKLYGIIIDASTSTRISDCLKSHSTLKEFVLSYSVDTVDIEGARKVFQALESQTQLQTLVIQINNLSIDCSFSLSKTIDNNRQLHSLTIFGDNSNHFECLLKSLTSHLYIEILSLILDQVTASFLLFINQLVQQNLSIRHLYIVAGNMSDRKILSSIFESLGSTQTIMNVELQSLDDEEEEQFQNAIQEIKFDNPFVSINASNGSSQRLGQVKESDIISQPLAF
ncbi:hypothetical protein BC833DRAFT_650542 [Globomyces pollinis-pini]|nr:hypothetical protein BC833DRAFT_650542 [Globomyces pollinis-pini]